MSSLTESDMKLLVLVIQNSKEPIQPDYKTITEKGGYGRVNSVQVAWCRLKKKIEAGASASASASTTGTSSSKASNKAANPKKRGRVEKPSVSGRLDVQDGTVDDDDDDDDEDEDDEDDDDDSTPTKYAKMSNMPSHTVKTEEAEDETVFD